MDDNTRKSICAYFFSEYDMDAVRYLGYKTRAEAYKKVSIKIGEDNRFLAQRMNEFDPFTSSTRVGYSHAMLPIVQSHFDILKNFSFDELCEIVQRIINKDYLESKLENNVQSSITLSERLEKELNQILNETKTNELAEIINFKYIEKHNKNKIRKVKKEDYEIINNRKSVQGIKAELIVLDYEINRVGLFKDIVANVDHVSQTKGDGLGYDILSYEKDGSERYIEVKSKYKCNGLLEFYISVNELEFLKSHSNAYIYFVYDINNTHPNIHIVNFNEIKDEWIDPVQFQVAINVEKI